MAVVKRNAPALDHCIILRIKNSFSDPTVTPSSLRWRDKFGMLANDRGIVRVAMYHECTYRCKHGCYRRAPGGEDRT